MHRILGQDHAIRLLQRAIAHERLAHAYLLRGPNGVGKRTTALAMASRLLCRRPSGYSGCGACPSCHKLTSGNHPDLLVVRPEGAGIKIDQIRRLKEAVTFPPLESDLRVILLEEVHTMRREAANSLLKLLEEPPPGNLMLLSASEGEYLLPTILSRCQVVAFHGLPLDLATTIIRRYAPEVTGEAAITLAALTEGSPGEALLLAGGELLNLRSELLGLLRAAEEKSAADTVLATLDLTSRLAAASDKLGQIFDLLRLFFRDQMRTVLLLEGEESGNGAREGWNYPRLSAMVRAVDEADRALARNCNPALVCETLLFRLLGMAGSG